MAKVKKAVKNGAKRSVKPIPRGYRTVTASLNQSDANATMAFMKKAFGAKVRSKMKGPGGKLMHAEVEIGDSVVMLSDAVMEPARQSSLFLYVDNVDKTMAKAVKAGAKVITPAENMFWGDRFGRLSDPQGNLWGVATRVENVRPAEMQKRSKVAMKQMAAASKN
jgi:PhnB protein